MVNMIRLPTNVQKFVFMCGGGGGSLVCPYAHMSSKLLT
jgi:hypothetical protein